VYPLSLAWESAWEGIYAIDTMLLDIIEIFINLPKIQRAKLHKHEELKLDIYYLIMEPLCPQVYEDRGDLVKQIL
jgi:hypothetical protein